MACLDLRAGHLLERLADRALQVLVELDRGRRRALPDHHVVGAGQVVRRAAGVDRLAGRVLVARDHDHHDRDDRDRHHNGADDEQVPRPLLALLLPHQRLGALRLRLLTGLVRHRGAFRGAGNSRLSRAKRVRGQIDQPDRAEQEPDVAGDVDGVLALRVGGYAAAAEAAAVDLEAARPGGGDADDEREEEQRRSGARAHG